MRASIAVQGNFESSLVSHACSTMQVKDKLPALCEVHDGADSVLIHVISYIRSGHVLVIYA